MPEGAGSGHAAAAGVGIKAGQGKKKMAVALGTAGIRKATSSSAASSPQRKHAVAAAAAPGKAVSKTSVCSAKQRTKKAGVKAEHVGEQTHLRAVAVSKASMARGREA
jgi:hypothetical protein